MHIKQLKQALPFFFKSLVTPLVIGVHGIGKSQAIRQFTEEQGWGFVDLRLGQMADAGDILGLPRITDDKKNTKTNSEGVTEFCRPSWLPSSGKGIVFLDEINRAHPDILQAIFQLVLDRRIHEYQLPEGWHVVAAMNPPTENFVVTEFNDAAFISRFCHIRLDPSNEEFFDYARKASFEESIVEYLAENPKMLECDMERFSLDYVKPCRRSWDAVQRLVQNGLIENESDSGKSIRLEVLSGLVGITAAQSYLSFLGSRTTFVKGIDVLKKFDEIKGKIRTDRLDMLKITCDEIESHLSDKKFKIKTEHLVNLRNFLLTINRDLGYSLLVTRLFNNEKVYTHPDALAELFNNDDLYKYYDSVTPNSDKIKSDDQEDSSKSKKSAKVEKTEEAEAPAEEKAEASAKTEEKEPVEDQE